MSNSLQPHGLQQARLPCPSPTPRACSNSCPLSQWCHPTISSSVIPFSSCPVFPRIRVFSSELVLCSRWAKYWSFSFNVSPFNKYSEVLSFRIDWFDLLCSPRNSQESSLAPQFESLSSLVLSLHYGQILTSVHDYWNNHSFDPLFFRFFSIYVIAEYLVEFPVLYSRSLLIAYFIYNSVYVSTPISQFIPPPHLLVITSLFSTSVTPFLFCR